MRLNVYSSTVFAECRPLCTQILPEQGRPLATIFGIRKLDTMLPAGKDRILLRALVLTQYRSLAARCKNWRCEATQPWQSAGFGVFEVQT